jgi:hypothetical protein
MRQPELMWTSVRPHRVPGRCKGAEAGAPRLDNGLGANHAPSTRTSSTVLTISPAAPDPRNVGVGSVSTSFTPNATITNGAETGTVRVGFDSSVQGGLTFTCSGRSCNSVSGFALVADDIEIAPATAASGAWDSNGVTDLRAILAKTVSSRGSE